MPNSLFKVISSEAPGRSERALLRCRVLFRLITRLGSHRAVFTLHGALVAERRDHGLGETLYPAGAYGDFETERRL
jgi:hypothetical protein